MFLFYLSCYFLVYLYFSLIMNNVSVNTRPASFSSRSPLPKGKGEEKGQGTGSQRERTGEFLGKNNSRLETKSKNQKSLKNGSNNQLGTNKKRNRPMSLSQLLNNIRKKKSNQGSSRRDDNRKKRFKPIIPPKSLIIILKEEKNGKKPEIVYNRRIIDYKHCGLLQRYIGLGGKILPRRQTRLTPKQQRYIAKAIKSARIMGLLPFVSKEKGYFR